MVYNFQHRQVSSLNKTAEAPITGLAKKLAWTLAGARGRTDLNSLDYSVSTRWRLPVIMNTLCRIDVPPR